MEDKKEEQAPENKEATKDEKKFIEREWTEDIEGKLDDDGFFITPNGSFWDPDYVYFNRDGFDKHGGKYDETGEYIPGPGWDDELNCYESEKELNDDDAQDDDAEEDENDGGNDLDVKYTEEEMMAELAGFDDDDDLFEGKDIIKNDPNIETVVQQEDDKSKKINNENVINDNNNNNNELDERESDEYEEIEDDEVEDDKKKDTKETENKKIEIN